MSLKDRVELYERQAVVLERVAKKYDEASPEYVAVRQAAIALWYALTERHDDFVAYLVKFDSELTPEQKAHLRLMGIDPDATDGP
ncbi:MAG TPA: hypothetical protein VGR84_06385 [Candidatus Acidoferrales bacterium]|nr:hypothetical protein [Candidatus Acidoferrales bacterium]